MENKKPKFRNQIFKSQKKEKRKEEETHFHRFTFQATAQRQFEMNSNPFSEFNQMTISWKRRGGEGRGGGRRRKEEEGVLGLLDKFLELPDMCHRAGFLRNVPTGWRGALCKWDARKQIAMKRRNPTMIRWRDGHRKGRGRARRHSTKHSLYANYMQIFQVNWDLPCRAGTFA